MQDALPSDLRHRPAGPARAAATRDPPARPGRRQPPDVLVPGMPDVRRVGHKGADLIAPGNTPPRFDAALAAGVDMIEFDVLPERADGDRRLVLAHDYEDRGAGATPSTLEEGLDALRDAYAASSSTSTSSSPATRTASSTRCARTALRRPRRSSRRMESRRSLRDPRSSRRRLRARLVGPAASAATTSPRRSRAARLRRCCAASARACCRAARRARSAPGAIDALMAHWRLVTPRARARGARRRRRALRLDGRRRRAHRARSSALGVTGVITNDPRLFDSARSRRSRPSSPPDRRRSAVRVPGRRCAPRARRTTCRRAATANATTPRSEVLPARGRTVGERPARPGAPCTPARADRAA